MNPEERRAYREGVVDQKLAEHDVHFRQINGQIGTLAESSRGVETKIDRVLAEMPRVLTVAEEAEKAKIVAAALAQKTSDERTAWQRYRGIVASVLGVIVGLTVLANFTLGLRDQTPPTVTVTIPDITPVGP